MSSTILKNPFHLFLYFMFKSWKFELIIKFLKDNKNRTIYPSDIAFEYNLDAKKVFEICQKLKREGKIIWDM